jgi:ribosomal protein S2
MSNKVEVKELLEAGVHLDTWLENGIKHGSYIYMNNGIHIINLYKTAAKWRS